MYIRCFTLILFVSLGAICAGAQSEPTRPTIQSLSFDKLLEFLPRAGEEFEYFPNISERAENLYSIELRRRLRAKEISGEQLARALLSTGAIQTHIRWPRNRRFAVTVAYPHWIGYSGEFYVYPQLADASPFQVRSLWGGCAIGNDAERMARQYIELCRLPTDTTVVRFKVEVVSRSYASGESNDSLLKLACEVSLPVTLVDDEDAAILPVPAPELELFVRSSLWAEVNPKASWKPGVLLRMPLPDEPEAISNGCGPRLRATLLDGDRIVKTIEVRLIRRAGREPFYPFGFDGLPRESITNPAFIRRAKLRLEGISANESFHDLRHDTRWGGSIEFSLIELIECGKAIKPQKEKPPAPAGGSK